MPSLAEERPGRRRSIWRWLTSAFVQCVPERISACEFQCHRQSCLHAEWASCPRRLSQLGLEADRQP